MNTSQNYKKKYQLWRRLIPNISNERYNYKKQRDLGQKVNIAETEINKLKELSSLYNQIMQK